MWIKSKLLLFAVMLLACTTQNKWDGVYITNTAAFKKSAKLRAVFRAAEDASKFNPSLPKNRTDLCVIIRNDSVYYFSTIAQNNFGFSVTPLIEDKSISFKIGSDKIKLFEGDTTLLMDNSLFSFPVTKVNGSEKEQYETLLRKIQNNH